MRREYWLIKGRVHAHTTWGGGGGMDRGGEDRGVGGGGQGRRSKGSIARNNRTLLSGGEGRFDEGSRAGGQDTEKGRG